VGLAIQLVHVVFVLYTSLFVCRECAYVWIFIGYYYVASITHYLHIYCCEE